MLFFSPEQQDLHGFLCNVLLHQTLSVPAKCYASFFTNWKYVFNER